MKEKPRFKFVDYLRGWALLVMIEVHVFNSMLNPTFKTESWFHILTFINGLVAPSFLFISGFAFQISSNRKLDELRTFGKAFRKKIFRILMILLVGYSLHFPFRSVFAQGHSLSNINWQPFFNVDILQCIAVGLFILFLARLIFKKDKIYDLFVLVFGLAVIFLSPVIWYIDFANLLHPFFASYFNDKTGSLFPLFPWLGFMFMGAVACRNFILYLGKNNEKTYFNFVLITGVVFILIGYFFQLKLFIKNYTGLNPSPLFFILRLGYVFVLLVACWYYEKIRNPEKSFVTDVGKESLLVYWLHLMIIYGVFWSGKSLYLVINHRFGIIECLLMTLGIGLLMIFAARLWSFSKIKWKLRKGLQEVL